MYFEKYKNIFKYNIINYLMDEEDNYSLLPKKSNEKTIRITKELVIYGASIVVGFLVMIIVFFVIISNK